MEAAPEPSEWVGDPVMQACPEHQTDGAQDELCVTNFSALKVDSLEAKPDLVVPLTAQEEFREFLTCRNPLKMRSVGRIPLAEDVKA
jgi:hypothetical protein